MFDDGYCQKLGVFEVILPPAGVTFAKNMHVLLIRLLQEATNDIEKSVVVNEFGNKMYKYSL